MVMMGMMMMIMMMMMICSCKQEQVVDSICPRPKKKWSFRASTAAHVASSNQSSLTSLNISA